ncbi:MAG: thioredoxin-disulfide reductase [Thermomicrobiales bacterium]|nr:thioredoxin-disulfide reductase [Thermomicrobiales bacterium]
MKKERVVIIGSGPAGLSSALYTARAQLKPVVIVGNQLGGQAAITNEIENYPGFPGGLSGPDLVDKMKEHAESFGAEFVYDLVESVDFSNGSPFRVKTMMDEYSADAVIVTIGADPRKLGVAGENEGVGKGVSYCGTCDGFFFRGREIVVVGGGDSALEEAIFLTRFASKVTVIHRRDSLRASKVLQQRAQENPKIAFIWNSVVDAVVGSDHVEGLRLRNIATGEESTLPVDGVFVAVGHKPNTDLVAGQIELDAHGYIAKQDADTTATNIPGVFAAGDVRDRRYRQAITSAGDGCRAAMDAERWLEARGIATPDFAAETYA